MLNVYKIIDHFRKWWSIYCSFVSILIIRPTSLILERNLFLILHILARLVRPISIKTKEHFVWPPLWKKPVGTKTRAMLIKSRQQKQTQRRLFFVRI